MTDTIDNTETRESLLQRTEVQQHRINTLVEQLAQVQRRLEVAEQNFTNAKSDWGILNSRLIEESNERDWCSEYDDVVDQLNDQFTVLKLDPRRKQYSVRTQVTLTFYANVNVQARDGDEAVSEVDESSSDLIFSALGNSCVLSDYSDIEWTAKSAELDE